MIKISIIVTALGLIIKLSKYAILAEAIFSYIPSLRENNIYQMLVSFNEPVLTPFRVLQSRLMGESMIDFSPIMAYLVLSLVSDMIISLL